MRKLGRVLSLVALAIFSHAAFGQATMSITPGKAEKSVIGLPFIADQSVHLVQHYANGMALTHEVSGHVYRSADGVERFDGSFPSTDPAHPEPVEMALIVDRNKHIIISMNSKLKTATITHLPDVATVSIRFFALPNATVAGSTKATSPENPTTSDLGHRTQGMMELVGKRVTATIPAGKIGNEQPIVVTSDVWIYPQLKLLVKEVEQNPLVGERTYELSNIRGEEPDAKLFEVPDGYTVKQQTSSLLSSLAAPPVVNATPEQRTKQMETALASPSANVKNSAAYALAVNNEHLDEAQKLAEDAVRLQEQTSAEVLPTQDLSKANAQMIAVSGYWDTLGWVYYRQGKLDQAEAYIRAAWDLKPYFEISEHLGLLYEAMHRPKDAIAFYRMAINPKNSASLKDLLKTHLANLGVSEAEPLASDVTTPLPSLTLHHAPSDAAPLVEILLTHGNPPAVTLLEGDPAIEKPLSKAIQSALANFLPDSGPEKILRRARVSCSNDETPLCALHFLSAQEIHDAISPSSTPKTATDH